MPSRQASVRFQEREGRLHSVEVRRSSSSPLVSRLHKALLALGVVVTSYQVQQTKVGLEERLVLSTSDGSELDSAASQSVREALVTLALSGDGPSR